MTPALYIRKHVFGFSTQREFAEALGYSQAQISRLEDGMAFSSEAQGRIRAYANLKSVSWDNNWFFEVPRNASHGHGRAA